MDRRSVSVVVTLAILALAGTACESGYSDSASYATPRPPSALEVAARETTVAQETRQAMEDDARGTAETLANERQATQQVLDLNATQRAQEAQATQAAWGFAKTQTAEAMQATSTMESRRATATREALNATAITEHEMATGTARQWAANVQGTQAAAEARAIRATDEAIDRASYREQITQPLRAWWGWALLILAVPCLVWLGWQAAKVINDRARVVKRRPDEGEPFVLLEQRDREGNRRIALPLRSFNALMDTGNVPALPSPEMQDTVTMRQQTANAIQARQTAATVKARKAHKSKAPRVMAQGARRALPAGAQRRRRAPGLVKVVSVESLNDAIREGILSPRLAETIKGQWTVKDEEA